MALVEATVAQSRLISDTPVASIERYRQLGGGAALQKALSLPRDTVIDIVKRSGLRGRGGAGFLTGRKWETTLAEVSTHPGTLSHVCCNAAEGEPATFKDRYLIRHNPYQLVEGLAIAAYACAASEAYIAIKASFAREVERLSEAMHDLAGADMLGGLTIRLIGGPEEYLFGEETAMLEVIEGRDPMPRLIPPYVEGLFAVPGGPTVTAANNAETLYNVPSIITHGPDWFRQTGTEASPGTMLFTLVGDVQKPGVYEHPLGITLQHLLSQSGGGPHPGRRIKAVMPGASHAVITDDAFEVVLDFDSPKQIGAGLGSAGFAVYDDSACMVRVAAAFSRFLYVESCGQCNACKLHSRDITALLESIDAGEATGADVSELLALTERVTDGGRCYLPTAEQVVVRSIVRYFIDEVAEHLDGRGCSRPRPIAIPKIKDLDPAKGGFIFDERQMIKRPDWTYPA